MRLMLEGLFCSGELQYMITILVTVKCVILGLKFGEHFNYFSDLKNLTGFQKPVKPP